MLDDDLNQANLSQLFFFFVRTLAWNTSRYILVVVTVLHHTPYILASLACFFQCFGERCSERDLNDAKAYDFVLCERHVFPKKRINKSV